MGEKVWSYNPQTKQMELEPIQHILLNHDNDLVDLTLTTAVKGSDGETTQKSEVIHTNEKHPFLTKEKGFIPVNQLKPGMHVREADGSYGVVARLLVVPGALWMYNLTVAQDHTYAVGMSHWIVHNVTPGDCGGGNSETINSNSDAQTAYQNVIKNLGREPGPDAQPHLAKFGDAQGLPNGLQEGCRFGWRLEWDPDKGGAFCMKG